MTRLEKALEEAESLRTEYGRCQERYENTGKELLFLTAQLTDAIEEIRAAMNEEFHDVT